MKIEEYLQTLPEGIVSGEQVELPDSAIKSILDFAGIGRDDVFYHMGCGSGRGVLAAGAEYGARRAVGIDRDPKKIESARRSAEGVQNVEFVCGDVRDAEFADATAILFWFTDEDLVDCMMKKFQALRRGCKIVTVWSPLPGCLPGRVNFPYMISQVPFERAAGLAEQVLAVFGVKCIDFVTAWEHAERYTRAIGSPGSDNDRFLTILQSVTIWINARNMGIACGDEMPESIRTYIGILRNFFDIEVGHLLK